MESRVLGIYFLLSYPLCTLLTTFPPKMYELATGHRLFKPEVVDDLFCDVVHLVQMTQRTGQNHDDAALKQYEIREKQPDLKGKETNPKVLHLIHLHLQACWGAQLWGLLSWHPLNPS